MSKGRKIELKTTESVLAIGNNGIMTIQFIDNKYLCLQSAIDSILRINVRNVKDNSEYSVYALNGQIVDNNDSKLIISYEIPVNQFDSTLIKAEIVISVADDAFCFSGTAICKSDKLLIKDLTFPVFSEISCPDSSTQIFWPNSLGERFRSPVQFAARSFDYPATSGSMPWFTVNSGNQGIYIGCHDSERGSKTFRLEYLKKRNTTISCPRKHIQSTVLK